MAAVWLITGSARGLGRAIAEAVLAAGDQLIATAFHRNTMTNDEGGTDNEEFRTSAVLDRVNTTWEAFMGTTFGCTQCHSHPYDPFRHEEYYKFLAFFNNTRDEDTEGDYPVLRSLDAKDSAGLIRVKQWIKTTASKERSDEVQRFVETWQPSINSLTADHFINSELSDSKWLILRNHSTSRIPRIDFSGKDQLIYRYTSWFAGGVCTLHMDKPEGPVFATIRHGNQKGKWTIDRIPLLPVDGVHDIYFTYENPTLKKQDDNGMMFDWLYPTQEFPGKGKPGFGYDALNDKFVNMFEAGIVDPAKVTRSALQNAASIAAMVLTTEAMVTEVPEEKRGGGGGMGGMSPDMM